MPKEKIMVYLDAEQLEQLRAVSKESGAPVAELIRRAVNKYMAVDTTPRKKEDK